MPRHTRPTKVRAMGIRLMTCRLDYDRSKDIRLATVYHTPQRIRPTKVRTMGIRLATNRLGHDRSEDIRLATIYHTPDVYARSRARRRIFDPSSVSYPNTSDPTRLSDSMK